MWPGGVSLFNRLVGVACAGLLDTPSDLSKEKEWVVHSPESSMLHFEGETCKYLDWT
jgi:hypothetical protein